MEKCAPRWPAGRTTSSYATPTASLVALTGEQLVGLTYTAPDPPATSRARVIYGDHVTLDAGTGAVHTAPGHGAGRLPRRRSSSTFRMLMPVDDNGVFTGEAGPLARP